jgi:TrmH family RNA methyltransferase
MITSSQNPKIKLVRALSWNPKDRIEAGAFVAEGVRLVEEAFHANWPFRFILRTEKLNPRARTLVLQLISKGIESELVSESLLHTISETETSQGILAVLENHVLPIHQPLDFVLIPDSIRDPGNLGTLLRTASAAGVQAVWIPPETTDPYAPKVVRAGMGAHFRMPIQAVSWEEIQRISDTAKLIVYLADMKGASCWETDLRKPLALIVGGEAEGASNTARRLAGARVGIPMPGEAESLNAGVAGAVLMFEVVRQRNEK